MQSQSSHPLIDSLWFVPAAEFAKQGIQGRSWIDEGQLGDLLIPWQGQEPG